MRSAAPVLPQARTAEQAQGFKSFHNYVALPRSEAFRIEYWALEEAKLQRMPPEREFSRKIALVVGGGSGIGREVALLLARRGAHVVVADRERGRCRVDVGRGAAAARRQNWAWPRALDLSSREQHRRGAAAHDSGVRRRRHRDQHGGDLSDARSVAADRRSRLGEDAARQRHRQLRAGRGGGADATARRICRRRWC